MKQCPYCAEEMQDEAIKCRYCREWLSPPPGTPAETPPVLSAAEEAHSDLEAEIRRLVQAGQKIQAIKLLRESSGLGLADAKSVVEGCAAGKSLAEALAQHQYAQMSRQSSSGSGCAFTALGILLTAAVVLLVWL